MNSESWGNGGIGGTSRGTNSKCTSENRRIRVLWVFFTSDNSLVIFIVINHILISGLSYPFIYLFM